MLVEPALRQEWEERPGEQLGGKAGSATRGFVSGHARRPEYSHDARSATGDDVLANAVER